MHIIILVKSLMFNSLLPKEHLKISLLYINHKNLDDSKIKILEKQYNDF